MAERARRHHRVGACLRRLFDRLDQLTEREKQVLQLIAHGKSTKEIAVLLGLSVNTVAVHRANLMSTLKVHKAAELVLYAVKKGLVVTG